MSSHHIVRDQQEPALIVEDIDVFPLKTLNEILGWSPTVVCLVKSVDQFCAYGLKLDHLIVDESLVDTYNEKLSYQWPFHIHRKVKDDIEQAIDILMKNGHTVINVLTDSTKKEAILNKVMTYNNAAFSIFTEAAKGLVCRKPVFSKWFPSETVLSLNALDSDSRFFTSGFQYNLSDESIDKEVDLIVKTDTKVQITSSSPFVVFETY